MARLRALSIRGDIIKRMHEGIRGGAPSVATVILDPERPPTAPVIGRVYGRGTMDELSDQRYLLVEAQEGQAYYVPLSASSERAGERARVGAIVRIAPAVNRPTGAADRSLASPSAPPTMGPGGASVIKVERLAAPNLDLQVQVNGVTWLDQELARGANLSGVGRVGATRFERELAMALKDRAQHLKTLGLAQEFDGGMHLKSRFLDALYERELEDAATRLRTQYGELTRLGPGLKLKGRAVTLEPYRVVRTWLSPGIPTSPWCPRGAESVEV